MLSRRYALCFLVIIAAFVLACSDASKSPAPTAPTVAASSSSTATIDLTVTTATGTPGAGSTAPVVGTVSGLTGACPEVTFVLSGVTVKVTGATKFESGTCADIQNGVRAGAIGAKNANGIVEAARVKVGVSVPPPSPKPPPPVPPPPPPPHAEGAVTGLSGSCPTLTFTLSGTTVHTSSTTVFEGGSCTDVKEGARAGAMGPKDAGGAINADRVKIGPPPMPVVTGTAASVSGTCPAVTFVVTAPATMGAAATTTTVRTSDKTRFEGGSCADIKAGVRVGAMGPKAADGSIDAQVVKIAPVK